MENDGFISLLISINLYNFLPLFFGNEMNITTSKHNIMIWVIPIILMLQLRYTYLIYYYAFMIVYILLSDNYANRYTETKFSKIQSDSITTTEDYITSFNYIW